MAPVAEVSQSFNHHCCGVETHLGHTQKKTNNDSVHWMPFVVHGKFK